MKKNMLNITQQELDTVNARINEILQEMKNGGSVNDVLIRYAETNGYSAEEAADLTRTVCSTVDQYNKECREHIDDESDEWILDRISERAEHMSLAEECRYKLGMLVALRGISRDILNKAVGQTSEQMDDTFDDLSSDELMGLDDAEYTDEILDQINEQLAEAVRNSGIELEMTGRIEQLIESGAAIEDVHGYVTDMWKDEQYKYAVSMAACVARKNNELPSLPEDITDAAITVGMCQGVDVGNVETLVSNGELVADKAYKILRTIATVGLVMITAAVVLICGIFIGVATSLAIVEAIGDSILAIIFATTIGFMVELAITHDIAETLAFVEFAFRKVSDFTYDKLKKGVKLVHGFVSEQVIPRVKGMISAITERVRDIISRIRRSNVTNTVQTAGE